LKKEHHFLLGKTEKDKKKTVTSYPLGKERNPLLIKGRKEHSVTFRKTRIGRKRGRVKKFYLKVSTFNRNFLIIK